MIAHQKRAEVSHLCAMQIAVVSSLLNGANDMDFQSRHPKVSQNFLVRKMKLLLTICVILLIIYPTCAQFEGAMWCIS